MARRKRKRRDRRRLNEIIEDIQRTLPQVAREGIPPIGSCPEVSAARPLGMK
jgi:hypothetical protein